MSVRTGLWNINKHGYGILYFIILFFENQHTQFQHCQYKDFQNSECLKSDDFGAIEAVICMDYPKWALQWSSHQSGELSTKAVDFHQRFAATKAVKSLQQHWVGEPADQSKSMQPFKKSYFLRAILFTLYAPILEGMCS